jgi:hypothetical protein
MCAKAHTPKMPTRELIAIMQKTAQNQNGTPADHSWKSGGGAGGGALGGHTITTLSFIAMFHKVDVYKRYDLAPRIFFEEGGRGGSGRCAACCAKLLPN